MPIIPETIDAPIGQLCPCFELFRKRNFPEIHRVRQSFLSTVLGMGSLCSYLVSVVKGSYIARGHLVVTKKSEVQNKWQMSAKKNVLKATSCGRNFSFCSSTSIGLCEKASRSTGVEGLASCRVSLVELRITHVKTLQERRPLPLDFQLSPRMWLNWSTVEIIKQRQTKNWIFVFNVRFVC